MPNTNTNTKLKKLKESLKGRVNVPTISGFIGSSREGNLQIYPSFDLSKYIEVKNKDILHTIDASTTDLKLFFIDPDSDIKIVSITEGKASLMMNQNRDNDKKDISECVKADIENCSKEHPKEACEQIRWLYEILCKQGPLALSDKY